MVLKCYLHNHVFNYYLLLSEIWLLHFALVFFDVILKCLSYLFHSLLRIDKIKWLINKLNGLFGGTVGQEPALNIFNNSFKRVNCDKNAFAQHDQNIARIVWYYHRSFMKYYAKFINFHATHIRVHCYISTNIS